MATCEEATSAMVDLSTTGGSAQFVLEKGLWRHGQQGSDVSSHSSTCSCGLHFGWQHSVLDKGFQLLGIFLYPGQHNLEVNPVIGVGFFHLENGGNLGQQLGQYQTPQELQSGHGDRLLWSYPGLGCHHGHSDGGILVEDSGIDHSSIASFAGVSETVQLH